MWNRTKYLCERIELDNGFMTPVGFEISFKILYLHMSAQVQDVEI